MALHYFNGCQRDAQIWLSLGHGLGVVGHVNDTLVEFLDNKGGFGLGYNPSTRIFSKLPGERKGSALAKGFLSLILGSLFRLRPRSSN